MISFVGAFTHHVSFLITAIAVSLFIVPSVTFAAWWNPISWFNSANSPEKTDIQTSSTLPPQVVELSATTSPNNSSSTESAKVADKNDGQSELQSKISVLTKQINSLQAKLTSVQSQLVAQPSASENQIKTPPVQLPTITMSQNTDIPLSANSSEHIGVPIFQLDNGDEIVDEICYFGKLQLLQRNHILAIIFLTTHDRLQIRQFAECVQLD